MMQRKEQPDGVAVVKGTPSSSGLWVYKDDHTDVRILGAIAKVMPELFSLASIQETIREEEKKTGELKAVSAQRAFDRTTTVTVKPSQGNKEVPYTFEMPNWTEMREGIAIPSIARGHQMKDPDSGKMGGFQPERNTTFKKYLTRTMRPVVNFDTCIKCTLCWLACPDSVFDVTPDGFYDANMAACCGCGVCEDICPGDHRISMINETAFPHNASPGEAWPKDNPANDQW